MGGETAEDTPLRTMASSYGGKGAHPKMGRGRVNLEAAAEALLSG
jgi:hypothetical protein